MSADDLARRLNKPVIQRDAANVAADAVPLDECPPGLFMFQGRLGFKTEYGYKYEKTGRYHAEAYVVESGEFFWGGAQTFEERGALMVVPLDVDALRYQDGSASNSGAEAMQEAAAKVADRFSTKSFDDANLIAHSIRALPLPATGVPASPWRDMQSAPKDGTRIIALYPIFNKDNDTNNPDSFIPLLIHWNRLGWDTGYWMLHAEPLAWMAVPPFDLPTPPASKDS